MTGPTLDQQLQAFVGRSGRTMRAPDPVNQAMINHWCAALGDRNPAYLDITVAERTVHGGIVAPPAMMQAWTMPGYDAGAFAPDAIDELYALLDSHGYVAIVATNSEQHYLRPLRLSDAISATKAIETISERKRTGLGEGYFVTTRIDIRDGEGAAVGRQLHRVLKFRPRREAAENVETQRALRPRPNTTLDTRFFFEGAKAGKLLIQGCNACGRLQHPPTAACARCGSFDLGAVEASGRATLFSYTVVHAPVVPPFVPGHLVALVDLEEGTRLVSELVDVSRDEVEIGMALEVDFLACDPDLILPVFRKARG